MIHATTKEKTMSNTQATGPMVPVQQTKEARPGALATRVEMYDRALEPQSLTEAYRLATEFASIQLGGVTSPADALGRIMTGRSMGLSTTQSLRGLYTVNGRQGIDAGLMHGLCLQSPVCEYFDFISADATQATFEAKRVGRPAVRITFTIEQAEKAGLLVRESAQKTDASNWTKWREDMLVARCRAVLARRVFPEVVFGLHTRDELMAGVTDEVPAPQPSDPNEIQAEVVPSPVQAAPRDWGRETAELKARIQAAKSRAELADVREALNAWDAVEPYRSEVNAAYNEASKAFKAARAAATNAGAASTDAQPAPAPVPVPAGNLFAEQPKS